MKTDSSRIERLMPFLRNSLFGQPLPDGDLTGGAGWDELLRTAREQTVLPLVADAISRLDADRLPPRETMARLSQFTFRNISTHARINKVLAKTVAYFQSKGMHTVLLKGQGLAMLYPDPQLRQCGDIDLYIGNDNYERACRLAVDEDKFDTSNSHQTLKHYNFSYDGVSIELHHKAAVIYTPGCQKHIDRLLGSCLDDPSRQEHTVFNGVTVSLPDPYVNAVFVFFHLAHHFLMEGVGLRQLCDLAMVLHRHHRDIDPDKLRDDLKSLNMLKMWQIIGYILVNHLGLPQNEMPLYDPSAKDMAHKMLAEIEECGNFGHKSELMIRNKSSVMILHKIATLREILRFSGRRLKYCPAEVASYVAHRAVRGTMSVFRPSEWRRVYKR